MLMLACIMFAVSVLLHININIFVFLLLGGVIGWSSGYCDQRYAADAQRRDTAEMGLEADPPGARRAYPRRPTGKTKQSQEQGEKSRHTQAKKEREQRAESRAERDPKLSKRDISTTTTHTHIYISHSITRALYIYEVGPSRNCESRSHFFFCDCDQLFSFKVLVTVATFFLSLRSPIFSR